LSRLCVPDNRGKKNRTSPVMSEDNRSISLAFEAFQPPENAHETVQICRPFAVLSKNAYSAAITLPLGCAYLASTLEAAGYTVSVLDALGADLFEIRKSPCNTYNYQGMSKDELLKLVDPNAKVLGVSMMFSQEWLPHREFIQAVKANYPDLIIIAGGEHPTAMPEYVLRDCAEIDYVVMGEGELTFLELVHAIFHGKEPRKIAGVCSIDKTGSFISNGLSLRIKDFAELPRPAWHLFKVDSYFHANWTMGISMGRNMPILSTRGCPYQCTFCSSPTMWTTRYKMRDPVDVVDEIEHMIKTYNANSIEFFDLTAIVKKSWIQAFCAELIRRDIMIPWQLPSGTRSEALDEETLQAMYDTKCRLLVYAPESGSQQMLGKIKKKLNLKQLNESVASAVKIGHTVKINLIIGFPQETLSDVLKTIRYGVKMAWAGVDDCNIAIFTPYPGSELYNQLRKDNKLPPPSDDYIRSLLVQFDLTKSTSYCQKVSGPTLAFWRIVGQSTYYLTAYLAHPRRIVRLLRHLHKPKFEVSNVFEQRIYDLYARIRFLRQTARDSCQKK